jgi:predicted nucleic-acid-binding protein
MIGLDTNVLVRYIVQDDQRQSALATRFIEKECSAADPGFISLVTLVELVWVSESCYQASKKEVVSLLRRLLSTKQLFIQENETVWKALLRFETGPADFSDYLVGSLAGAHGCKFTVTFDKLAAGAGMQLLK